MEKTASEDSIKPFLEYIIYYQYNNCPPIPDWDLHRARTIFDKPDDPQHRSKFRALDKKEANTVVNVRCNKDESKCLCDGNPCKVYNPDKPYDYDDVKQHFFDYAISNDYALEFDEKSSYMTYVSAPSRNFQLMPYQVTQGEFEELMGFNPSWYKACGNRCPVENVTWYQAVAYANALSKKENLDPCYELEECTEHYRDCKNVHFKGLDCRGYRLPTDEEWRYFAEDAVADEEHSYLHDYQNEVSYEGCQYVSTRLKDGKYGWICIGPHPVGQLEPDRGVYDIYGFIYEWVWDWFGYAKRAGDSLGPDRGLCKIYRGNSTRPEEERGFCYLPNKGSSRIGFRLARTLDGYIHY